MQPLPLARLSLASDLRVSLGPHAEFLGLQKRSLPEEWLGVLQAGQISFVPAASIAMASKDWRVPSCLACRTLAASAGV